MFCHRNHSKSIVCFMIFFSTAGISREFLNWNTKNKLWNLFLLFVFLHIYQKNPFWILTQKWKMDTELNRLNSFVIKI